MLGRHAGFECKAFKQLPANTVDGTDTGLAHGGGQVDLTLLEKVTTDPLAQLGSGFSGKGRGNHPRRLDLLIEQLLVQYFSKPVGFAAAGASTDKSDVCGGLHCHCSQPAKAR